MSDKTLVFVGIDFGTTFSSIAYYNPLNKTDCTINDEGGNKQIPSWVSFAQMENSGVIIGNGAKNEIFGECVLYDSKRIIGSDISDISDEDKKHWPFTVIGNNNGKACMEVYNPFKQKDEIFEPEEISGMVLKNLILMAKSKLDNTEIGNIVVTVPTEFDDKKRNATLAACKLAGIENVTLVNEPVAALVEYKRTHNDVLSNDSKVVVIDFGGGTLDICCCKLQGKDISTVSVGGDKNVGGNDFDAVHILGEDNNDDLDIGLSVSRKEFEELCEKKGLYKRLISKIKEVTGKSDFVGNSVQLVLLVGGTCLIKRVRDEIAKLYDVKNFSDINFDSLTAVAKGAAYLSHLKSECSIVEEKVYEIVPKSIGIEVNEGRFYVLIREGEQLPTSEKTKMFKTYKKNQEVADFRIYRGTGNYTSSPGVEFVTAMSINGFPLGPAGSVTFKLKIKLNESGLMELSANVFGTDIHKELAVTLDFEKVDETFERLRQHFNLFPIY
ncbi:heat shock protein 70 putative [Entamoeba histolytica]|uniref:Heat shock protein 70, putative n=2 Tax=Entamoeba histolytica TaxID=5759 RepID=B1N3G6_ENTH1|nr:heat shock protein 70, putative [Entamoeba histolytica HM-1:IMSS]EDS89493.1 heat shock protein 70, putative [Entamoeba histolytica HM-1:IMSS]GAT95383.1 heat shock protein 70 putative [Entamoeba histolytica]|eukprot:XP_001913732.1 heat shock protein 70, putative [Entamoeba histolytica HM-1:IMSS]